MIYYEAGGCNLLLNIFRCRGSVFATTVTIAIPAAAASCVLHYFFPDGTFPSFGNSHDGVLLEAQAWGGFSFLVGFLIVFRTSQAYSRFEEGCSGIYRMQAEWFDAVASVVTFTKYSTAPAEDISRFKELVVRVTSMLHAAALADLEAGEKEDPGELWAYSYDILDPAGIDTQSLEYIKRCDSRTELLFIWLQQLIVENINTRVLSIPAPILSRVFQELANGMVAFHDARRISFVPFPFPYAQACDCVLVLHWLLVPIITSQWVTTSLWAGVFTFIQVFILWSLNLIAIEIDHPFGRDDNDIDGSRLQVDLNSQLCLLIARPTEATPHLSSTWSIKLSEAQELSPADESWHLANSRESKGSSGNARDKRYKFARRRPSTLGEIFRYVSDRSRSGTRDEFDRTASSGSGPIVVSKSSLRSGASYKISDIKSPKVLQSAGTVSSSRGTLPDVPESQELGKSQRVAAPRLNSFQWSTGWSTKEFEESENLPSPSRKGTPSDARSQTGTVDAHTHRSQSSSQSLATSSPDRADKRLHDTESSAQSAWVPCPCCGEVMLPQSDNFNRDVPCSRCHTKVDPEQFSACKRCSRLFCSKCLALEQTLHSKPSACPKRQCQNNGTERMVISESDENIPVGSA